MKNSSQEPLFDAAVSELVLATDYAGSIGVKIQVPPASMKYGPLQVCYAFIPRCCLSALNIIEYSGDSQCMGDIPLTYPFVYRGQGNNPLFGWGEILNLFDAINLLKEGKRRHGEYHGKMRIDRPLEKLHIWIGAGQRDGPYFDFKKTILAHSLVITATFR